MAHVGRAVVLVAALAALPGCTSTTEPEDTVTASPSTTTSASEPTTEPTTTTAEPTDSEAALAAWFIVDAAGTPRLAREVLAPTGGGVEAALEVMISGPSDPDYSTPWNAGTDVLAVDVEGSAITVDLSADSRDADVDSETATLMVQQLVYTVTEAVGDPEADVTLLIDGEPAGTLWGGVAWNSPVTRADPLDVRMHVQLDAPTEGQRFTNPEVTIQGEAVPNGSSVTWRVFDAEGAEAASGVATSGTGTAFEPFSFTVELRLPGYYTVEVTAPGPGGPDNPPVSDTRSFSVHLAA